MIIFFANARISVKINCWLFITAILFLSTAISFAQSFTNELDQAFKTDNQNKFDQSIIHYTRALQIQSNSPRSYIAYLSRGRAYFTTKQLDKAEADFDKAIMVANNSNDLASAYFVRGLLRSESTNQMEALDDLSKAILLNPTLQLAYIDRAKIYVLRSCFDSAVIDCKMAILLKPDDAEAYYWKGYAYKGNQNYVKEIEALNKVIELATNFTGYAEVYSEKAIAYANIENFTNAISDLSRAIELDPKNATYFATRGYCLSCVGDFSSGIIDCKKAVQIDESSVIANNNLAWLLATAPEAKLRDGKKAVKYATRACDLSGWKDAYCIGTLAAGSAEVGNFDEAIKWEQKCIQIGLLNEKAMAQARKELELFKEKKPYHSDN